MRKARKVQRAPRPNQRHLQPHPAPAAPKHAHPRHQGTSFPCVWILHLDTNGMDDDFGADEAFLSALAASDTATAGPSRQPPPNRVQQPAPQKIQQPTPQRLDRPPPNNAGSGVKQPAPQALPQRSAGSSILVSPRQKGNPVLACLKSLPWEYSDIPADYGLGLTTCALFLRFVSPSKAK